MSSISRKDNQLDQIFFLHHFMIVRMQNKYKRVTKSLVKWPRSAMVSEIQNIVFFSRKLQKATQELNLDKFETTSRFIIF